MKSTPTAATNQAIYGAMVRVIVRMERLRNR